MFGKQMTQLLRMLLSGLVMVGLGACRESESTRQVARRGVEFDVGLQKISIDDSAAVAVVDDVAIYPEDLKLSSDGGGAVDPQAALERAIRFELLAAEARERRFAEDPIVFSEFKKALAMELLRTMGDGFTEQDIPNERVKEEFEAQKVRFVHGIQRKVVHALAAVKKDSSNEASARQLADRIYAAASTAESENDFRTAVQQAADGQEVKIEDLPLFDAQFTRLVKPFVDGTFAIPFPDTRVSQVVRTRFGFHIIFVVNEEPALNTPYKTAAKTLRREMLPGERNKFVTDFIDRLYRESNVFVYDKVLEEVVTRESK